jgi:UDP-4-amino-4-deoxy-L-arabinose-oxoglutarate aminotransferase
MQVPFYIHSLDSSSAASVEAVLSTAFLTSGSVGRGVEAQLCEFFGTEHALLTNSWTNGAVATLLALDIGPGDEVIVPAMTFVATSNVVELVGARPVFVDVDPDTLLLRPEDVAAHVTPRTRAVIPVHLYGQMVDMAALRAAVGDDIALIEDAAHCFEGRLRGDTPGRHSDAAIFSFYATKNVTCGEGGAIVTRRTDLHERLMQTRLHGMSAGAIDRMRKGSYRHWDMACLGTKANLPDLLAALLPDQISGIRDRLALRNAVGERYRNALTNLGFRMQAAIPECENAWHLMPIHVPTSVRDDVIGILNAEEIGVTVNYQAVPTMTYYREKYGFTESDFPVSQEWGGGTLSLPLYPGLGEAEQDFVLDVLRDRVAPLLGDFRERAVG